jgi:ubiquinone/menaquinone biosynthesis C-methylase UbiE
VRDFFEETWQQLPERCTPPDFARRAAFLRQELKPGVRMLDVGCGAGEFTALAAAAGTDVIGIDVAQAALERARRRFGELDFQLVEIAAPLPFEDCTFGLAWASEVIEHVADTARWLSELRRVLAPAGKLLITTPAHGRLRLLLGGIERYSPPTGDHLHLYSASSLAALLDDFDFGEISVSAVGGPPLLRHTLFARAVR